jgi:hypothetical protein
MIGRLLRLAIGLPLRTGHTLVTRRRVSGSHTKLGRIYLIKTEFVIRHLTYADGLYTKYPLRFWCGLVLPNSTI